VLPIVNPGRKEERSGVWVWMEPLSGKTPNWVFSLIRAGRSLAEKLTCRLVVVVPGWEESRISEHLKLQGIGEIIEGRGNEWHAYSGTLHESALIHAVTEHRPLVFMTASTVLGREITARLSAGLPSWFLPRCTAVEPAGVDSVRASKLAYGGQMERVVDLPLDRLLILCMERAFLPPPQRVPEGERPARVKIGMPRPDGRERVLEILDGDSEDASLLEAEIVVAGGGGVEDRECFYLVRSLARELGGVTAGSQVAVERGWISRSLQIGRSGRTVYPDLFIACGISGSPHFTSGMDRSGTIVAVNSDPTAPIFGIADVKVVGDLRKVIPSLIREMRKRRSLEKGS